MDGSVEFTYGWETIESQGIKILKDYLVEGKKRYPTNTNLDGSSKVILFLNEEYSQLYTLVYEMATQEPSHAAELYEGYKSAIVKFLQENINPALEAKVDQSDIEFLSEVVRSWQKHGILTTWLYHIFYYLDRYYVTLASAEPLQKAGLMLWVSETYCKYFERIMTAYLNLVEQDRKAGSEVSIHGEDIPGYSVAIDESTMRSVTIMIMSLQAYSNCFIHELRPALLNQVKGFYTDMSCIWISTLSFTDYLRKAKKAFGDEQDRCFTWFFPDLLEPTRKHIQSELLKNPLKSLLSMPTAVEYLLQNELKEDLRLAYLLIQQTEKGLSFMAERFKQFINDAGSKIISDKIASMKSSTAESGRVQVAFSSLTGNPEVADLQFVKSLLDLHTKFREYTEKFFYRDFNFTSALKEAFESFLNVDIGGYPMAAFLCTYCDKLIRRPPKAGIAFPTTQQGMEEEALRLVDLFMFLQDKDLFAEGYRQQMARRLIGAQDPPGDTEKFLVARFKHECGNSFSSKLEGMLADVTQGLETRQDFEDFLKAQEEFRDIYFGVQVLTTGHWPSYPHNETIQLPPVIEKGVQLFKDWYDKRTAHRRLTWVHAFGQAMVTARLKKTHELVCSAFQATLLLAFNESEGGVKPISLSRLGEISGLNDLTLKKQVKCLYGKYVIVRKRENPERPEDPLFEVNMDFAYSARRFKLPVPMQEESKAKDNTQQDRSIAIQAAIVRIMKSRKSLTHGQLVTEVISHLSLFKPQIRDIKAAIEALIQRDYLARGEEESQHNIYTYVA